MLFVLPTDELLQEPEQTDRMLAKAELSLKLLTEAVISQWAAIEAGWSMGGFQYMPLDATVEERVGMALTEDYLNDQVCQRLSNEEMHDIHTLIRSYSHEVFEQIVSMLEEMNLTQYQLQTLSIKKWLGRSLVVDIVF